MRKAHIDHLTKLADQAANNVAHKVVEKAAQTGTPVIVWQDGAIRELPPQAIELEEEPSSHDAG